MSINPTLFAAAGVSKRGGKYTFRGTNRLPAAYEIALEAVGDEDVRFETLPTSMTKEDAKAWCANHPRFADLKELLLGRGVTAMKGAAATGHTVHTAMAATSEFDMLPKVEAPKEVQVKAPELVEVLGLNLGTIGKLVELPKVEQAKPEVRKTKKAA